MIEQSAVAWGATKAPATRTTTTAMAPKVKPTAVNQLHLYTSNL
jgi:hypothetical protein